MMVLNERKPRDERRQIAYITMPDGKECSVGNVPIELDTDAKVLEHLEKRKDEIELDALFMQWPEADWPRFKTDENTDLAAFQKWITEGCKNKIIVGYYKTGNPKYGYQIIEKQPWRSTHPPELALTDKINKADIDIDLKTLLKDIIM